MSAISTKYSEISSSTLRLAETRGIFGNEAGGVGGTGGRIGDGIEARIFIYLFYSRDDAIHPKGICGLGKAKEMNPVADPRSDYHNSRKSTTLGSALCAGLGVPYKGV
jgi:hypothetical protein